MDLYLLGKNDALNYRVLFHFLHQGDFKADKADLMDKFALSSYKLEKAISSLNADLAEVSSFEQLTKIIEVSRGIYEADHLSNAVLHNLRTMYLRRSVMFIAFEYRFIYQYRYTKVNYLAKMFLSNSPFYEAEEKLDALLEENEFYNPYHTKGREFAIRQHLFQIYFESFPTVHQFPGLNAITSDIISDLVMKFQFDLSHTRFLKLKAFLKIWILRLQTHQFVEPSCFQSETIDDQAENLRTAVSMVERYLTFSIPDAELQYLHNFLIIESYLDFNIENLENYRTEHAMAVELMRWVYENQTRHDYSRINREALLNNLLRINIALSYFYVEPTTFVENDQIDFFELSYPLFSRVVHEFIDSLQPPKHPFSDKDKANLYLSYMFVLINIIPMKLMVTPIYIYVDFSLGNLYTEYIEQELTNYFRDTNIQVQRTLNEHTDLYLSDLPSDLISIPQLIWENPPTHNDWYLMHRAVAKIKHAKDELYQPAHSKHNGH